MKSYLVRPLLAAGLIVSAFAIPLIPLGFAIAQAQLATPRALASTLLNQINNAEEAVKRDCSSSVLGDGRGQVSCTGHEKETVGEAWTRYVTAAGVPKSFSEREALAHAIGLDPQASLVLAGPLARIDAIDYLLSQLRQITGS